MYEVKDDITACIIVVYEVKDDITACIVVVYEVKDEITACIVVVYEVKDDITAEEDEEQLIMRRLRNSVDELRRGYRSLDYKMQRIIGMN